MMFNARDIQLPRSTHIHRDGHVVTARVSPANRDWEKVDLDLLVEGLTLSVVIRTFRSPLAMQVSNGLELRCFGPTANRRCSLP